MTNSNADTKAEYIELISKRCDRYGDLLLALMNEYGVDNLQSITAEQAKAFYFKIEQKK